MKVGVFFGGGAKIALHAGYTLGPLVDVKFDRVMGVSAGSLWASIIAFIGPLEGVAILSTIQKTSDIFGGKDLLANVGDLIGRKWDAMPIIGMNYNPLKALLEKYIIGIPHIPVTVSRVNLETGKIQRVTAYPDSTFGVDDDSLGHVDTIQDFRDAILSSCLTYPLVDAFLDSQGRGWIDGGFREGGPVLAAIEDRATELHLCLTGLYSQDCGFNGNASDPLSGITRVLELMGNQNVLSAVNLALKDSNVKTFIYQSEPQGTSDNFNQKDIQANITIGKDTKATSGPQLTVVG